jgi:ferredoxin
MSMEVEIRVDRIRCIGAGQCVHVAPGVFDQDREAKAFVVDHRGEPEDRIVHALTACPVQAVTLHVDGTPIAADDLRDWALGARSEDPLVPLLERFSEDHHELRTTLTTLTALTATPSDDEAGRAEEMCSLTSTHLRDEEQAYSAITALVDPRLVDAFEGDHGKIDRSLEKLTAVRSDPVLRRRAMTTLATVVDDHIRLEETVLFPLALAALARGRTPVDSLPGGSA